jgi:hypothetical protein
LKSASILRCLSEFCQSSMNFLAATLRIVQYAHAVADVASLAGRLQAVALCGPYAGLILKQVFT